ncbi:MAG: carbon-nitrogen hydrolase family protein [Hahellaceae bacterium]|nr:carbon-nitrogen hydrolase family protein [Hahellaceae bacterium]
MHGIVCVAAIQLVSTADLKTNLLRIEGLVRQAVEKGAHWVVLPENFALMDGAGSRVLGEQAQWPDSEVRQWLARLSSAHQIWIFAGSLPDARRPDGSLIEDGRVRSVCRVYGPDGVERARYDKLHLFDVDVGDAQGRYRESERFEPGESVIDIDIQGSHSGCLYRLHVGLSICYDLRFPALFSHLRARGCDVIVVPAAFTFETGRHHWKTLLRARAIENQVYIVAPNQGGEHDARRRTWGHSMIIDPWGEVLDCVTQEGEGIAIATLDADRLVSIRKAMPLQQHQRPLR